MKRSLIERLEAIDTTHADAKEAAVLLRKISHNLNNVIEGLELPMPQLTLFNWHEIEKSQKNMAYSLKTLLRDLQ